MTAVPICLCGDLESQHKMRKGGCRAADCGCDRFEVDEKATAEAEAAQEAEKVRALTTVAEVCKEQGEAARVELADLGANRVHDVELAHAEALQTNADLDEHGQDLVDAIAACEEETAIEEAAELAAAFDESDVARLNAERDLSRARIELDATARERDQARASNVLLLGELEQLRVEHQQARDALDREKERRPSLVVARDGGRGCMSCYQEIRRGEAYEAVFDGEPDALRHVHCPDAVATTPAAIVLYAYDAWSCLVDGGCGARYTVPDPQHLCGRLTPTRVTITHRTEGAPS